jgi:PIN domain nuclease of toxin-antitoxin system
MRLLLDTHVLLWWLNGDTRLRPAARRAIERPGWRRFVSAASIWEMTLKLAVGKLALPPHFGDLFAREPFEPLAVTAAHALRTADLPPVHRDPFDRLLVAQCLVEGLTLVTADERLLGYSIPTLRA